MDLNTIFYTVLSGTLVYTIGQIINKFFIEPIHSQKKTFGKISNALIYYANIYTNPVNENSNFNIESQMREDGHLKFRNLACELISKTHQIPLYKYLSWIKIVPRVKKITESHSNLIGLSNGMYPNQETINHNEKRRKSIEKMLNLITG